MGFYNRKHPRKTDQQPDLFTEFTSYRNDVEEFISIWNGFIWLPKIVGSDRQSHAIRDALQRPFFQRNWRASFPIMAKSPFLRKMKPQFRLDWYLIPDNFDKIVEGFYLDEKYKNIEPSKTTRTGDDEEIL